MTEMELLLLTPMILLVIFKLPVIYADEKIQRKLSDPSENYIITHYGLEYYTPVTDADVQMHNSGYFTAEVIPVDVKTGEELKTVKNLFVPLHTGYSIGVSDNAPNTNINIYDRKDENLDKGSVSESKDSDSKNKIPKKFKKHDNAKKIAPLNTKKNTENFAAETSTTDAKKHDKRFAEVVRSDLYPFFHNRIYFSPQNRRNLYNNNYYY